MDKPDKNDSLSKQDIELLLLKSKNPSDDKMDFKLPIISGIVFGLIGIYIVLNGYGWLLYNLGFFLILIPIFLSFQLLVTKGLLIFIYTNLILIFLPISLSFLGHFILLFQKSCICKEMDVLNSTVENYRLKTGHYPETLKEIDGEISKKMSIQVKRIKASGNLDFGQFNEFDVTIYFSENECVYLVRVTKLLPMSMTRFYVYQWMTSEPKWVYTRVIWTLGNSENKI